jgi:hypothetical protein
MRACQGCHDLDADIDSPIDVKQFRQPQIDYRDILVVDFYNKRIVRYPCGLFVNLPATLPAGRHLPKLRISCRMNKCSGIDYLPERFHIGKKPREKSIA